MFELTRRNHNRIADFYDPFRAMEELERRFFSDAFRGFADGPALADFKTDIFDEGDHFVLEADLPGFSKDNIRLELAGDTLTIQAERSTKSEEKDKKDKLIRRERSYGSYTRQFNVSGIDTDGIKCKYRDGVLSLTLPKRNPALPASKQIAID